MRLLILTKRSLLTLALCLLTGVTALTVALTSAGKAVQTAATPKENPVYRVESTKKQVAISFDAAWGDEQTAQLLDILDQHKVKATFFLVGDWVDKLHKRDMTSATTATRIRICRSLAPMKRQRKSPPATKKSRR